MMSAIDDETRDGTEITCLRFLENNGLLISGFGLGSGFYIEEHEGAIHVDFAYPTSKLACHLVEEWWNDQERDELDQERRSVRESLTDGFL